MKYARRALAWLKKGLSRRELFLLCLISGLCLGFLAHGFMFANKIPNHDDLQHYADLGVVGVANGRYVLHLFWKLFSDLSTPWLNGILGTLFLCAASFLLCESYDLNQRWQALAMVGMMQLYPVNVSTYCYMYEAHVFMLGVALAAAAVWVVRKGRGWTRFLWCALLTMLSTGIYQVYVMFIIGLLILLVIRQTLQGVKSGEKAAMDWRFAIGCAASALIGLALYLVGLKLIQRFGHAALNSYQGIDQSGRLDLAQIPEKILRAYNDVWRHFVSDVPDYVTGRMRIFHTPLALLGMAALCGAVIYALAHRAFARAALLTLCALLIPLACCGIYFMGDDIVLHMITYYPLILIHLIPLVLIRPEEGALHLSARNLTALAALCLYLGYGFQCAVVDNQAYYRHYLSFTRAEHMAERIAARIEALPEYEIGAEVAVVGYLNAEESLIYYEYDVASRFLPFVGVRMELDYYWNYTLPNLLSRVIGLPITGAGENWQPEESQLEAIAAMPCYPAEGSIAFVDGTCIVKLSEQEFATAED